jgi:hypothetical protein
VGEGGPVLPDRLAAQSVAFIVKACAARLGRFGSLAMLTAIRRASSFVDAGRQGDV